MAVAALKTVEGERGTLVAHELGGGVFVSKLRGHFGVELLPTYLTLISNAMRVSHVLSFNDWEEMTSYDSECRTTMVGWVTKHRAGVRAFHVLVRSRIVAMGVSAAALLIGGELLHMYSAREDYLTVCRAHGVKPL
jgi:hypothetical protein